MHACNNLLRQLLLVSVGYWQIRPVAMGKGVGGQQHAETIEAAMSSFSVLR
jgi:hypothetical protein